MDRHWERTLERAELLDLHEKVTVSQRLSFDDGVRLYTNPDLNAVGHLANLVRERLHGNRTYWVRNQHLNYTNFCNKFCKFCSFYRPPNDPNGYCMTVDEVRQQVRKWKDFRITELHMVGGVNHKLPYEYYLDIVRAIKDERPEIHVKAYTMVELAQIQRLSRKSFAEVFADLKAAGVESLPGGGAEVFSERVHEGLFHLKGNSEKWVDIARTAHQCGLPSNSTLLYGHIETVEEKVEHHLKLRELQDETSGILTFIPLHFHPERTDMSELPHATGMQDLREIAVARLMLDNVPHLKSFWIMIGKQVAQVSQWYGADDVDGTIMEYEITRDPITDRDQRMTIQEMQAMIIEAGRVPVERDNLYNEVVEESALAA